MLMASASSWAASDDVIPVEKYQPPIVEQYPPGSSHGWNMERPLVNNGLNLFAAKATLIKVHRCSLSNVIRL